MGCEAHVWSPKFCGLAFGNFERLAKSKGLIEITSSEICQCIITSAHFLLQAIIYL